MPRLPRLVRFYIRHTLIGFAVAAAFVAMILWFNLANLWHLVSTSDIGALAVFMLWMFHGIVFSGVQFGISIMRMAEDGGDSGGKRDAIPAEATVPVPVPVRVARWG